VEHEALEYVVGYVARQFVHKYPDLGNETSVSLDSSLSTSWTQHNITRPLNYTIGYLNERCKSNE